MLNDQLAALLEAKKKAGWTGKITLHIKDGKVLDAEETKTVRLG